MEYDIAPASVETTVLLVDDNPMIVRALSFGLCRRGFKVLTAGNGHEAAAIMASSQKIDLLFSDVVMPGGMSGVELARTSLGIRPGLPVLLTTGYAYDVLESMGADKGEFQIVTKPYSINDLVSRIHALLPADPAEAPLKL